MKKGYVTKLVVTAGLAAALVVPSANAFARGGGHDRHGGGGGRGHHGREEIVVRHERYTYRDGRFFKPWFFGLELAIAAPLVAGAIVSSLPFGHRTIVVAGTPYYYYDGIYYQSCPSGYVVVPMPAAPQQAVSDMVTINVPNRNGSYTPVVVVRRNGGYLGPQGEFYPGRPTVDQLRALYGS